MQKTPNRNLNKPEREDRVKISDLNQNADIVDVDIAKLQADVATKAPIHNPTFSGEPKAPTPGSTKVERIATTGYVMNALEVEVL